MIRTIAVIAVLMNFSHVGLAQSDNPRASTVPGGHKAIHQRLESYVAAFNKQDAVAVAAFWSPDCVSTAENSASGSKDGEALQQHFAAFFGKGSGRDRLAGQITAIQMVRPDRGRDRGSDDAGRRRREVVSVFAATLVKDGKEWLISNSRERDVRPPTSPHEALQELEWLIGTWQDQSEDARVVTTVRWSPNRAFLIRSFTAQFPDEERQGTQIITSGSVEQTDPHVDIPFGWLVRARNRIEARPSLDAEDVADSRRWSNRGRDPGNYSCR